MDTNLYSTELSVTRPEEAPKNEQITMPHLWIPFKKGDRAKAGDKFPTIAVERNRAGLDLFIAYYGVENALDTLIPAYNIFSQSTMDTVIEELKKANLTPETIEFNKMFMERYTRYMTDLETRGESKEDLKNLILQHTQELSLVSEEQVKAAETQDWPVLLKTSKDVKRLTDAIKKCNLALAVKARKRKKNVGEEDEEVTVGTASAQPA